MVSSDRLEPGATAQLKVSVDTAGRSGRMTKQVTVRSNDRVTPTIPVTVMLTVTADTSGQK
ncbi:MAG: DUF1573 domain-containing protein [Nitrospirae bacterium]|nr:DUF1573 domain-containing protein [Nitrospirota bacterium]